MTIDNSDKGNSLFKDHYTNVVLICVKLTKNKQKTKQKQQKDKYHVLAHFITASPTSI